MPNYRRVFVPGGCWLFTVNLLDRQENLLVEHIDLLRLVVTAARQRLSRLMLLWYCRTIFMQFWTLPPRQSGETCTGQTHQRLSAFLVLPRCSCGGYSRPIGEVRSNSPAYSAIDGRLQQATDGGLRFANPPY
jgi:hypothetical protein